MKRTQIQLPDDLYEAAHKVADRREISLAELVRRGLEYMVAVTPSRGTDAPVWTVPEARDLRSVDPFSDVDWRADLHMGRLRAAEERSRYGGGKGGRP